MTYLNVILSAGAPIRIGEDELPTVYEALSKRSAVIVTRAGIFDSAFYVQIVVAEDLMKDISQAKAEGRGIEEKPSEFARVLSQKMKQLR